MGKAGNGATRRERALRTREEIQAKALELFRQKGFDATSLAAIVRAAGVSKGAFYAHYKSKVGLIHEYLGTLDLDYRQRYASMPEGRDAPTALADFSDSIAGILETRLGPDLLRAVYRAELTQEIALDPFVSRERELYRVFGEILERGKKEGSFRSDMDCARASDHIVMAIRGMIFEWCARYPGFDLHKELAAHMAILTDGLRVR